MRLVDIIAGTDGPELLVAGADLVDQTPILDIKPYVPLDCHPDATTGFIGTNPEPEIHVSIPADLARRVPLSKLEALQGVLARDPRPVRMHDANREFGLPFAGLDVRFRFDGTQLVVTDIAELTPDAEAAWPGYRPSE